MQDKYRFRAWDKQEKKYIYDVEKGLNVVSQPTGNIRVLSIAEIDNSERYVLEQCSGLKDNDGRLIYENDIVRIIGDYNAEQNWVRFDGGRFTANGYPGWGSLQMDAAATTDYIFEVIDNVHESSKWNKYYKEVETFEQER